MRAKERESERAEGTCDNGKFLQFMYIFYFIFKCKSLIPNLRAIVRYSIFLTTVIVATVIVHKKT